MSWNYRLVKHVPKNNIGENAEWYGIHEVYYTGTGKIKYWSTDPMDVVGVTFDEAKSVMEMMKEAFDKPVLCEVKKRGGRLKLVEEEKKPKRIITKTKIGK